jgi:hypothetical protein
VSSVRYLIAIAGQVGEVACAISHRWLEMGEGILPARIDGAIFASKGILNKSPRLQSLSFATQWPN